MIIDFFRSENIYSFSVSEALVSSIDDRDRVHVQLLTLTNPLASDLETRPAFLPGSIDPSSTFHPFEYLARTLSAAILFQRSSHRTSHLTVNALCFKAPTSRKYLSCFARCSLRRISLLLRHFVTSCRLVGAMSGSTYHTRYPVDEREKRFLREGGFD